MSSKTKETSQGHGPQDGHEVGHGDSVASWTAVGIIMFGTATGTLAFWLDQAAFVWASVGIVALGVPVGILLKRSGYGVGGEKSKNKH